jgi:osmoprotectant transport system permease protein
MSDFFRWEWVVDHSDDVWLQLTEHLRLTAIAVVLGFLISFPLAVFAFRHKRWLGPITGISGLLYTIPSLALFAFLVPFTGLSTTTAEIGLVSYTLLILIRNTVAGLEGVSPDAKDAALGMGYTKSQMLWKVEVPLAVPAIAAGIRIATVTTIGLVTVTALVGKGGLGFFILFGLSRTFSTAIVLGSVLSVILAMTADFALTRVERLLTPWSRPTRIVLGGKA